ncbi:MAG: hypothetical protein AAF333_05130 [Planctomycetota bacterium]
MDDLRVAYLAEGKLYLHHTGGAEPTEVISRFAQDMIERDLRRRQKDEWKRGSAGWAATGLPAEAMGLGAAFGEDLDNPETRRVNIVSVAAHPDGEWVYALETDAVGGLFAYDPDQREERRLVHRSEFRVADLDVHPADGRLACCLAYPDGSANLAVMDPNGGKLREITEGDSLDQAPSWVAGAPAKIVYQSAGIARNEHGHFMEVSPYRVEQLDLESGEHEVLFGDDAYDCMMPRALADGSIFYVRRPYQPRREQRVGAWPIVKDILLFPVRLAVAVVAFLNFFSMIFAKKPLITAGGPRRRGANARQLFLYGRLVETEKARKNAKRDADRVVVPDDWELVRSLPNGKELIYATGVGDYALLPGDAGVVYTDGSHVVHLDADDRKTRLAKSRIIERVAVLTGINAKA